MEATQARASIHDRSDDGPSAEPVDPDPDQPRPPAADQPTLEVFDPSVRLSRPALESLRALGARALAAIRPNDAGGEVRARIVGDEEMAALHQSTLGDPTTTDVLTFDLTDGTPVPPFLTPSPPGRGPGRGTSVAARNQTQQHGSESLATPARTGETPVPPFQPPSPPGRGPGRGTSVAARNQTQQHGSESLATPARTGETPVPPVEPNPSDGTPVPLDVDLVLCADQAERAAAEIGVPVEHELLLYLIHGVLHCSGYDDHEDADARAMHAREDEILRAIGVGPIFARGARPAGGAP